MAAARSKDAVVVHLQPADLGSITMIIDGDRTNLKAEVYSDQQKVRDALQQMQPQLTQQLHQKGIDLTALTVQKGSELPSNYQQNPNQGGQADPQPQRNSQSSAQSGSDSTKSNGFGIDPRQAAVKSTGGVDLWI
jgi:flagellar hook-length control protein FliK